VKQLIFKKKNQWCMRSMSKSFLVLFFKKELLPSFITAAMAQPQDCPPRPSPSVAVTNPFDLVASGGKLHAAFTMRSREMLEFPLKVCYTYQSAGGTVEAPTLRLAPADRLDLALTNRLSYVPPGARTPPNSLAPHDPCRGGAIALTSTNLAFDGLAITAECHQGEAISTTIENTDPPFDYRFAIPGDTPPGMYLYHPHLMGSAALQVDSGASGVLIVGGMEQARPEVAGLPERILVFRRQFDDPAEMDDASWISLNFQPAGYRHLPPPVIPMRPGAHEFWRVANATSATFLSLQIVNGDGAQPLRQIALDGVPTTAGQDVRVIELPPGGRAEFLVKGPSTGQKARLVQSGFDGGPIGADVPPQTLATLTAAPDAEVPVPIRSGAAQLAWSARAVDALAERQATTERKLYFAEAPSGTNGPTRYFVTVEGQQPRLFDRSAPAAIVTRIGAVEDWIVANHTGELHAFHVQGLHYLLLEADGRKSPHPAMRDTVTVPAWNGHGDYPTITVRMDFSGPRAAGAHIVECHDLHHAEAGMMAMVQVDAR
jgi:FtsP/CotA-like multicopper oxidase with cupredoxin domain